MTNGPSPEARNTIERAADAALKAAEAALLDSEATPRLVFVSVHAEGLPAGELDVVTACSGTELTGDAEENARVLLRLLLGYAIQTGAQLGVDVVLVPMENPIGGDE